MSKEKNEKNKKKNQKDEKKAKTRGDPVVTLVE